MYGGKIVQYILCPYTDSHDRTCISLTVKDGFWSEMYSVAKGTREEIYEFMMGDLDDEVTKYLPSAVLHSRDGVCRDAAKLLRAKIILFHRDETKYQVALNDMKEIITSGRYRLNLIIKTYG